MFPESLDSQGQHFAKVPKWIKSDCLIAREASGEYSSGREVSTRMRRQMTRDGLSCFPEERAPDGRERLVTERLDHGTSSDGSPPANGQHRHWALLARKYTHPGG
ncbi:hypothetical protein GGQ68_003052 [Sagittula marina]|uniref:Uncharacterized protein n=1 Tax=Sagittula marina TaxID=943940 RepID=A0A7W6DQ26_9RHOB|nr:hypothetical protein [Sagittula marina]